MKKTQIILPAILCSLIIYISKMEIWYYPLSFGLVIGLVNWNIHKNKPYIGVFLSVIISFTSFGLAFFCFGVFSTLREFLINNTIVSIGEGAIVYYLIISAFVIAPILVFISYSFLFKIPKTKFSLFVMIISIIILIINAVMSQYTHQTKFYFSRMLSYAIWQIVMSIAIQIVITQKKINK